MMIRIVKLTFRPDKIEEFLALFNDSKTKIRAFPGCNRLELLNDINTPNVFFTYSYWDKPESLEKYRNSELFNSVWAKTKVLFDGKPGAWSVEQKVVLE
ncbi:MAG: antibiotic biosynthesis monooxygenase [Flavobacteriales bacterium]|nr:antibiotic biosynthesis monooxygenase [Flavobacteriales bacterium]